MLATEKTAPFSVQIADFSGLFASLTRRECGALRSVRGWRFKGGRFGRSILVGEETKGRVPRRRVSIPFRK